MTDDQAATVIAEVSITNCQKARLFDRCSWIWATSSARSIRRRAATHGCAQ
jgi:hypothetical protein